MSVKEKVMAAKKNAKKVKGNANPDYIIAMRGIRLSSAAGTHDNRTNRQRTRSTAKRASINNSGW
jgi:hypothetical protein